MRDRKMLGMGLIIGSAVTSGVVCSKAVTVLVGAAAGGGAVGAVGCVLWPLLLVVVGALLGFGLYRLGCFLHDKFGQESEIETTKMRPESDSETDQRIINLLCGLQGFTQKMSEVLEEIPGGRLATAGSTTTVYGSAEDLSDKSSQRSPDLLPGHRND